MTKSSKGVEGYTHLHQRNWCNLKQPPVRRWLKVQITENPNLCNTSSIILLLLSLADLHSWQPSRRDTASFYVCVMLNSHSNVFTWWVCHILQDLFLSISSVTCFLSVSVNVCVVSLSSYSFSCFVLALYLALIKCFIMGQWWEWCNDGYVTATQNPIQQIA